MPHIHDLIDFTVGVYIFHEDRVLLVHHKKLENWLPVGGHIELDQDPEEALFQEVQEECGLEIELFGTRPDTESEDTKFLVPPDFLDIHKISDTHRHVGLMYIATSKTDKVTLAENEHNEIRWFKKEELDDAKFGVPHEIVYYCKEAFKRLGV